MQERLVIAVGSSSYVKVEAARLAFAAVFPSAAIEATGYSVPSSVPSQPMDDHTTMLGAANRAMRAAAQNPQANFSVGLEGGLCVIDGHYWFARAWAAILRDGKFGYGSSQSFAIPEKIMLQVSKGKELGEVCDAMFGTQNLKQREGFFGYMTNGFVSRTGAYRDMCIVALAQYFHPDLFKIKGLEKH